MDGYEFEMAELDALERVVGDATAEPMNLSLPLLKHITKNFSDETIIGSGGFAFVYLGTLSNGSRIAVKRIRSHNFVAESAFDNEVYISKKAAHKNIVRLIGYCTDTRTVTLEHKGETIFAEDRELLLCMEYIPKETLDRYITDDFHGGLDWNQRYQILKEICQALSYLHDEVRIIHGDIKPRNVLLEDSFLPKLFDFGLSMCLGEGEDHAVLETVNGTLGYLAPEFLTGYLSFKSDIYSLGVVIAELLTGSKGYDDVEQVLLDLRKSLVKEGESSWENKYHQVRTCLKIGYTCMESDPDKRPTALEIIQMLDETECMKDSGSSGHAPPFWQLGDEASDLSDTDVIEPEPESTAEFPSNDDELAETSTQLELDKPDTILSEFLASADLSNLKVLEISTDDFSHKRIVGKDGTFRGAHKAFVYKGDIARKRIAVKRLIGVEIPVEKFKREAEQFMSLNHKNVVKVAGYCHDESRGHKLVQFKGKPLPQVFNGPEQLISYEYMHNGSLREYLIGQGSREIDWHMRYKLIKGTCEGLHYLHKGRRDCRIVHLNLNPSNVLLDENNVPHITGFDFSKLIGEKKTKSVILKINGPIAYLPPDFFHSKAPDLKYLASVDIYSLGLMILEIVTRQEIKGDHGILIKSVEENWREDSKLASLYTSLEADQLWQVKLCFDIGLDCVKSRPERRPTAGDIITWLEKGRKSVPVPVPVPRPTVPRPPVRANITTADEHIQEKEKRTGFKKLFGWK